MPAETGIQSVAALDSGVRRNDDLRQPSGQGGRGAACRAMV